MTRRNVMGGGILLAAFALVALGQAVLRAAPEQQAAQVPRFEVDPFWPKPLPNHWVLGWATGVTVDSQDHIWMVQLTRIMPHVI